MIFVASSSGSRGFSSSYGVMGDGEGVVGDVFDVSDNVGHETKESSEFSGACVVFSDVLSPAPRTVTTMA